MVLLTLEVPFICILAHVIKQKLFRVGLHSLVCCASESMDQEARGKSMRLSQRVNGVLAVSAVEDCTQYQSLVDPGIPILAMEGALHNLAVPSPARHHLAGGLMMSR